MAQFLPFLNVRPGDRDKCGDVVFRACPPSPSALFPMREPLMPSSSVLGKRSFAMRGEQLPLRNVIGRLNEDDSACGSDVGSSHSHTAPTTPSDSHDTDDHGIDFFPCYPPAPSAASASSTQQQLTVSIPPTRLVSAPSHATAPTPHRFSHLLPKPHVGCTTTPVAPRGCMLCTRTLQPKLLNCLHIVCRRCLEPHAKIVEATAAAVDCPICHDSTPIALPIDVGLAALTDYPLLPTPDTPSLLSTSTSPWPLPLEQGPYHASSAADIIVPSAAASASSTVGPSMSTTCSSSASSSSSSSVSSAFSALSATTTSDLFASVMSAASSSSSPSSALASSSSLSSSSSSSSSSSASVASLTSLPLSLGSTNTELEADFNPQEDGPYPETTTALSLRVRHCFQCGTDEKIPANVFCHECGFLCDLHHKAHGRLRKCQSHRVTELARLAQTAETDTLLEQAETLLRSRRCTTHPDNTVDAYCLTCATTLCADCLATVHVSHQVERLDVAAGQRRTTCREHLVACANTRDRVNRYIAELQQAGDQLDRQREHQLHRAFAAFDAAARMLEKRRAEIVEELLAVHEINMSTLRTRQQDAQQAATKIDECLAVAEPLLAQDDVKLLSFNPQLLVQRCDSLMGNASQLVSSGTSSLDLNEMAVTWEQDAHSEMQLTSFLREFGRWTVGSHGLNWRSHVANSVASSFLT